MFIIWNLAIGYWNTLNKIPFHGSDLKFCVSNGIYDTIFSNFLKINIKYYSFYLKSG
jgi:hypothetical protein